MENTCNTQINKAFMLFANLLTFEAPADIRKYQEYITVNEDKTFSLGAEQTFFR